jgi:hypothetical protein
MRMGIVIMPRETEQITMLTQEQPKPEPVQITDAEGKE